MSYSLKDLSSQLKGLGYDIDHLIRSAKYEDYDDLSGLCDMDYKNIDDRFLIDEYRGIFEKLQDALHRIKYLNQPVIYEGKMYKNSRGRYETTDGHEYASGSGIEVKVYNNFEERYDWVWSSVEHNGKDYYIVCNRYANMNGLTVRRRSRG